MSSPRNAIIWWCYEQKLLKSTVWVMHLRRWAKMGLSICQRKKTRPIVKVNLRLGIKVLKPRDLSEPLELSQPNDGIKE